MYSNVVLESRRQFSIIPDSLDQSSECFGKDSTIKSHTIVLPRKASSQNSWGPKRSGIKRREGNSSPSPRKEHLVISKDAWRPNKKVSCSKWSEVKTDTKLTGLLNKLTPENFKSISEKLLERIATKDILLTFVNLLVTKAVSQTNYIPLYTKMCFEFKSLVLEDTPFTEALLERVTYSFETNNRWESDCSTLEESDINSKKKEAILGNFKFIAHLYKYKIVSTKVIFTSLRDLITTPQENEIETFVGMITSIGNILEKENKRELDSLFEKLSSLKSTFSTRTKFMIMDLEDLRTKQAWVPRIKVVVPKTLGQVKEDHYREQAPAPYKRLNLIPRA